HRRPVRPTDGRDDPALYRAEEALLLTPAERQQTVPEERVGPEERPGAKADRDLHDRRRVRRRYVHLEEAGAAEHHDDEEDDPHRLRTGEPERASPRAFPGLQDGPREAESRRARAGERRALEEAARGCGGPERSRGDLRGEETRDERDERGAEEQDRRSDDEAPVRADRPRDVDEDEATETPDARRRLAVHERVRAGDEIVQLDRHDVAGEIPLRDGEVA